MPHDGQSSFGHPLTGIRVIDLGWITAGAGTSTLLRDLGADVIKIEGPGAPDPFRRWEGAEPGTDWWNRSPFYNATNRGKRSLCLDLKHPRGRAALEALLECADVLVENYRRGVLASLGLEPAVLLRRFPRLVIASISSQGEDGPDRDMVSYGSTLEATGGLAALTGVGDQPVITGRDINYPDQVVCLFASGAIIAALLERRCTGRGAHLDLSQRELTTFLLGEEMIAAAEGVPSRRRGNIDPVEPDEQLLREGNEWRVAWPGGTAPVRDPASLVSAPEFARSGAIQQSPDGIPVKGFPFRLTRHPISAAEVCHPLGADNRAVLREAGFDDGQIESLEEAGVIASTPGSNRP